MWKLNRVVLASCHCAAWEAFPDQWEGPWSGALSQPQWRGLKNPILNLRDTLFLGRTCASEQKRNWTVSLGSRISPAYLKHNGLPPAKQLLLTQPARAQSRKYAPLQVAERRCQQSRQSWNIRRRRRACLPPALFYKLLALPPILGWLNHPNQDQDTLTEPSPRGEMRTTKNRNNQGMRLKTNSTSELRRSYLLDYKKLHLSDFNQVAQVQKGAVTHWPATKKLTGGPG